jgi:phosphoenolpyruvate carboxylase
MAKEAKSSTKGPVKEVIKPMTARYLNFIVEVVNHPEAQVRDSGHVSLECYVHSRHLQINFSAIAKDMGDTTGHIRDRFKRAMARAAALAEGKIEKAEDTDASETENV